MTLVCMSPEGDLEVWDEAWEGNHWNITFYKNHELWTFNGLLPGPIEFWGREVLGEL